MKLSLERLAFAGWRSVFVVTLAVLVVGYFYLGQNKNLGTTFTVSRGDFKEQVSVSGTVISAQDVALGFAANGRIAGTYARVGEHVWAGTILAEIENGDLAAALAQKRSALIEAQAKLDSLKAGTRPEEVAVASIAVTNAEAAVVDAVRSAYTVSDDAIHNKIDSFFTNSRTSNPKFVFVVANSVLQATVEQERAAVESVLTNWASLVAGLTNANAAASAQTAQTYLGQVTTLLADANTVVNQGLSDSLTSATTLASYVTTVATARSNVNAAVSALSTSSATLASAGRSLSLKQAGSTSADIAAQEASVAAAAADVQNAQAAFAKTRIVAPFSGTVTRMNAKVGEIVSPSTSEISMQSDGIFEIETFIPEIAIAHVAIDNPATTTLDAYGSTVPFAAKVISVDPAETVKDGVPTYKTTLAFLAADPRIRSGMTTNVVIETGELTNAIVVPSGVVGRSATSSYVTIVLGNTFVNRSITTGSTPALGQIEIITGLSAGDVILLTPAAP